jgi:bifunctional non-homologous end joining protein LigD
LLQNYRETGEGEGRLIYYVFDILSLAGQDLRQLPLIERKKILKKSLPKLAHIQYSDHVEEHGIKFFQIAKKQGLEGVMAKDAQSPYVIGRRTMFWQKIKLSQQQEAVVGGFTEPRGGRKKMGALVLGVYERGKFIYIGHTGGGFNEESLNLMHKKLMPLVQKQSPFEKTPKTNAPATWVKPKLVVEIKFEEWTGDGHMRQPIFLGLRPDKKPTEVRREVPL